LRTHPPAQTPTNLYFLAFSWIRFFTSDARSSSTTANTDPLPSHAPIIPLAMASARLRSIVLKHSRLFTALSHASTKSSAFLLSKLRLFRIQVLVECLKRSEERRGG